MSARGMVVLGASLVSLVAGLQDGAAMAKESAEPPRSGATFVPDVFSHWGGHRARIDLNGTWAFRRDPDDRGKARGWHEGKGEFADTMKIPGAPQAQGFGEPTQVQKTFFMEPFWVRRTCRLPKLGADQRVWLRIGGILPAAEIHLNGKYVGYTQSSRTQQRVDVTSFARASAENLIAIKVCDFPEVRLDGIYEMGEYAKTWTGVYRPVSLEITDRVSVLDAYVQPDLASGSVKVSLDLSEAPAAPVTAMLSVMGGKQRIGEARVVIPKGHRQATGEVALQAYKTWSPNHPHLYTLEIALVSGWQADPIDRAAIRFGMREMSAKGTKFYLNGTPIFWRCFGDDQLYLETLCPPADKDWFLTRLKRARAYGMNGMKGCVETISQDCIEAADEAGIMIIQEMPFGLSDLRANRYTIDTRFRDYYAEELDGLVRVSRNHASVVAYSMSSEMEFGRQTQASFDFFSRDLVRQTRRLAPHALVIDCTGYLTSEETKKGRRDTDFYASIIGTWSKEVLEEAPVGTDRKHPTLLHEYNWWSNYPDPSQKPKYANAQMKPFWLDTLVKTAWENGQGELIDLYCKNSLWLQALCRKDGIEYTRRNPDVEGYILWLLIDYHRASEGLLDDFWDPKNVSAETFLESNGDTVVVLAKEGNRCLTSPGKHRISLAVDHYGEEALDGCVIRWKATGPYLSQQGTLEVPTLNVGELTQAGDAALDLPATERARKFELQVSLHQRDRLVNTNRWSFWAFPEMRDALVRDTARQAIVLQSRSAPDQRKLAGASFVVTDIADAALGEYVEGGGACLLLGRGIAIENTTCYYGSVSFYRKFRTIPWNAGNSGNSGTVISHHPALEAFPHEGRCDLQFLSMIKGALPMEFSPLSKHGVTPIIRAIDHYMANRNNAYLLEFKVGKGKVLVTSLGILEKLNEHVEARYLLKCLLDYAQDARFAPVASVPKDEFVKRFGPRAAMSGEDLTPRETFLK